MSGAKVLLTTANFETERLVIRGEGAKQSVLIPTQGTLRTQLNVLETFATTHVTIPPALSPLANSKVPLYKALWQQDNMYVSLSPWCDFYLFNQSISQYTKITSKGPFGKGVYNVTFEVPYIYLGEHKDGHLYSLTLRAVQVVYQPTPQISDVDTLLDSLIDEDKENRPPKKKDSRATKKNYSTAAICVNA